MDYSCRMLGDYEMMEYSYGSRSCRTQIGNFYELPPEIRNRHAGSGVVSNFITNDLARWRSATRTVLEGGVRDGVQMV